MVLLIMTDFSQFNIIDFMWNLLTSNAFPVLLRGFCYHQITKKNGKTDETENSIENLTGFSKLRWDLDDHLET